MQTSIDSICAAARDKGRVDAQDVLALRRNVFSDASVSRFECERLFDLAQAGLPGDPEWPEFFIEAIADYIVEQVEPRGYLSEANADWLIGLIERDGRVWSETELELTIKIMEKAIHSPPRLVRFALDKMKDAVLRGEGPTRAGMELRPGCVGAAEVDVMRRLLYAYGGSGQIGVSREEAEVLFEINDATLGAENDPSWNELFVKAIAHHVLAFSGVAPPPREEALRRERWLEDTDVSPLGFFSRMLSSAPTRPDPGWADRVAFQPEAVSAPEALWLRERILRNGKIDPNQRALLDFIEAQADIVHPSLRDISDRAA